MTNPNDKIINYLKELARMSKEAITPFDKLRALVEKLVIVNQGDTLEESVFLGAIQLIEDRYGCGFRELKQFLEDCDVPALQDETVCEMALRLLREEDVASSLKASPQYNDLTAMHLERVIQAFTLQREATTLVTDAVNYLKNIKFPVDI